MNPITTAIGAALSAGASSGLTEISKTAGTSAYSRLKGLLTKKFGATSEVVQTLKQREAKPGSPGRQAALHARDSVCACRTGSRSSREPRNRCWLSSSRELPGLGKFALMNTASIQVTNHWGRQYGSLSHGMRNSIEPGSRIGLRTFFLMRPFSKGRGISRPLQEKAGALSRPVKPLQLKVHLVAHPVGDAWRQTDHLRISLSQRGRGNTTTCSQARCALFSDKGRRDE